MPDKDDGNNESDCFVVLTMGGSEIGRTSPVANTANPNWPNVWTISSGHVSTIYHIALFGFSVFLLDFTFHNFSFSDGAC